MITDIAVERVEFRCPKSHWQSVVDYDVVLYADAEGDTWEFFSVDGVPTLSPYTVDGAPLCPPMPPGGAWNASCSALHPGAARRRPQPTAARISSGNAPGAAARRAVAVGHINACDQPVC
ncbi:MAG: hypothetical protein M3460_19085 [Actinomycetota bacterium]|nr:hypothetical protein [Actinomycetota bacterium]